MRWMKLGQLFDPTGHRLPGACREFAQSPQALVFDGFVRIYFSTRSQDPENGKYRSHVAFVDMDKAFKHILRVSDDAVIELGKLGCFDEHGICPMNVVRCGDRIYAYTCGWSRRTSVSVETAIGLAISTDDGLSFKKLGDGPILASSLHEPFLVGDPFVKLCDDRWHMWYIYGTQWKQYVAHAPPERIYKIGHAVSGDGVSWRGDGRQIVDDQFPEECQAHPTVFRHGNRYHLYFCYRQPSDFRSNRDRSYRLGYAHSTDLVHWTREDSRAGIDVSERGWDSDMLCYPHAFECDGAVYLLYNGNEFGRHGFGLARLEAAP